MVDINSPIVKEFLIESFENLSNINEDLTRFESSPNDTELLNSIYRKVHTLKGSSNFLGLKILQKVTHVSENILDKIRAGEISLNEIVIDKLLESFDACLLVLKNIESSGDEGSDDFEELVETLTQIENGNYSQTKKEAQVKPVVKSEKVPNKLGDLSSLEEIVAPKKAEEKLLEERVEIKAEKESTSVIDLEESFEEIPLEEVPVYEEVIDENKVAAAQSPDRIKVLRNKVVDLKEEIKQKEKEDKEIKAEKVVKQNTSGNLVDSVVRVNVGLLDKIMNVVGELVLNRNQILQYANTDDSPELNRLAHQLNAITTELQTDIMTTRMQPVGSVLSKFERVVRDLSRQQDKKIKLHISGKETELDKTLLEAIRDPLTHLIRNSVDHGIENPQKRVANGKSETGTINIKSFHEGGQVTIEISDDGNGIDPDKIKEKAISKGLITAEHANSLSKKQILNLIFTPGFSTAEQITNISGRGVGMDVVKSNIEKIGGSVDITSQLGEGTVFKLRIPLTLAIVPALVVQSSNETYAIPQVNLVELVRIEEGDKSYIETIHDSEFFRLRGDLIPVFRLDQSLEVGEENNKKESDDVNIVILSAEGSVYGLIVDQVLDTEEIVVKPLSRELKEISIYGGATIMGDGSVALIVDALGYYNFMGKVAQNQKRAEVELPLTSEDMAYNDEVLLCLLEDGREYGIPLAIVHRLEEFQKSSIEWSGNQAIVRYRGKAMPIIGLEPELNLGDKSALNTDQVEIPVVVINARGAQIGFVVTEIRDIAINKSQISTDTADRVGFEGTAFINDKTVTILDIFSIVDNLKFSKKFKESQEGKGKVLVVEDSHLFLRIQKELFIEAGYEVVTALNGQDALAKFSEDFVAVVTDIDMPVMTGWDLVKKIRENEKLGEIPIVAVSSIADRRRDDIINAGFDFCFDKQNNYKAIEVIDRIIG